MPKQQKMSLDWLQRKPDSAGRRVPPTGNFSSPYTIPSYNLLLSPSLSLFEAYLVTASLAVDNLDYRSLLCLSLPIPRLFYCTIIAFTFQSYIART